MASSTTRRHSRDDPREDDGEDVCAGVGVGVVECQLYTTRSCTGKQLTADRQHAREFDWLSEQVRDDVISLAADRRDVGLGQWLAGRSFQHAVYL